GLRSANRPHAPLQHVPAICLAAAAPEDCLMYRHLGPGEARLLPLRMLFQPATGGLFLKACEADSWRGLVAALLDDPAYESADAETRLVQRLRLGDDAALLAELQGRPGVRLSDHDADSTLNVSSDSRLIL